MLHQLVAQITGAVQAAHTPTDGGGVPIGWALGAFAAVVSVLGSVVGFLYKRGVEDQREHRELLLRSLEEKDRDTDQRIDRKDAVIDALKEQVRELTQQIIDLHATAGPDRDRAVRALRAATRVLARLTREELVDDEEDDG